MLLAPVLGAAAIAAPVPAHATTADGDARLAGAMDRAINRVRAAHGLPALRQAEPLARGAAAHSRSMVRYGYFGHAHAYRPPGFQTAGEIIEWHVAPRGKIRLALRLWLASPPHRRLVLSRGFRYVGSGTATGAHRRVWTVRFGTR